MVENDLLHFEETSAKTHTNSLSTICSICGIVIENIPCKCLVISTHVQDTVIPNKAHLSLPDILRIDPLVDGTNKVRSKIKIHRGTRFGPLEATKSFSLNPSVQFPIKVFPDVDDEFLEYYFDTTNEQECTWMMFVQTAEIQEEQNLVCYQDGCFIYYATIKDIDENEELRVWYAPYYATKMKSKVLSENQEECHQENPDVNKLIITQQNLYDRDSWTCKFCGVIKEDVVNFANHIIEHYLLQLRKKCEICKATFVSRKSLLKHMRIIHSTHCKKRKTDPSENQERSSNRNISKELSLGGPLLNSSEIFYNCDNSNLSIPAVNILDEDLQSMVTENLNVDNLLMENVKAFDHFNFDIEECQEEFVCDICVKSFSKLRYLIQHLRRHIGEYFCSSCQKVFCRKENQNNHSCSERQSFKCEPCNREFFAKKYYRRHIQVVHHEKFKCNFCNHNYANRYELDRHKCVGRPTENSRFSCKSCSKSFSGEKNLKIHVSRHHSTENLRVFLCSKCPKQYLDKYSHDMHFKTHGDPEFQCEVCDKKFHKKWVYKSHLKLHENQEFACDICSKVFNSSKSLYIHKKSHDKPKFKCNTCDMMFKTKSNLDKHSKSHQKTTNTDILKCFTCQYCSKKMKLKSSLVRHLTRSHPESKSEVVNKKKQDKVFTNETRMNSFLNNSDLDMMVNSKDNIDLINDADVNEFERKMHIQMIDNILLNTTKEMGIEIGDAFMDLSNLGIDSNPIEDNNCPTPSACSLENREVCLSMPDLMDQDVTLGDNAFILDNGTIIEPKDDNADNVVIYILNKTDN